MKTSGMKQTSAGRFYMPAILASGKTTNIALGQDVGHTIAKVSMPGGHDWTWQPQQKTFTAQDCRNSVCGICGNREETLEDTE